MKSLPIPCGNFKMKGKLTRLMYCRCCVAVNFKWRERWNEASKEIKAW